MGSLTGRRTEQHTIHTEVALGELERAGGVETVTLPTNGIDALTSLLSLQVR